MTIGGNAWVFGDHIDTDVIIPARHLTTADPKILGAHCMEDADREFSSRISPGDVIVGGENFGCGSSREHAPIAIKGAGISCVVAKSFARIFYRNSINVGLPIFICPEGVEAISQGDKVTADMERGIIKNETTGQSWSVPAFPEYLRGIIAAGGLVPFIASGKGA